MKHFVAAYLLSALLVGAPNAQVGETDPATEALSLTTRASRLVEEERVDEAVVALLDAEAELERTALSATTAALRDSIRARLAELDPLNGSREALIAAQAETHVGFARSYRRKKWYVAALLHVEEAEALVPGSSGNLRASLERSLSSRRNKEPEEEIDPSLGSFEDLSVIYQSDGWSHGDGAVQSPRKTGNIHLFIADKPRHGDHRLRWQMRFLDANDAMGALLFGVVDTENYYLAEALTYSETKQAMIRLFAWFRDEELVPLGEVSGTIADLDLEGWLPLELDIRGARVRFALGTELEIEGECPTIPHGSIGAYVSTTGASEEPVEYRNLEILPLPPEAPDELDAIAILRERIDGLEERIESGEVEAGVLELRELQTEIQAVEDITVRGALIGAVRALMEERDPLFGKREESDREQVDAWLALADEQLNAARPFTARRILKELPDPSAERVVEARKRVLEALAPILAERAGYAPEPDRPVENESLGEWMRGAAEHFTPGWTYESGHIASPTVEAGMSLLASKADLHEVGSASVQVRVTGDSVAGLTFALRNEQNLLLAGIHHAPEASLLFVSRKEGDIWRRIASTTARFSPAAQAAWTTLELYEEEGQFVVRFGGVEELRLVGDHAQLTGRLGLFAAAEGSGAAHFRNLVVAPPLDGESD